MQQRPVCFVSSFWVQFAALPTGSFAQVVVYSEVWNGEQHPVTGNMIV